MTLRKLAIQFIEDGRDQYEAMCIDTGEYYGTITKHDGDYIGVKIDADNGEGVRKKTLQKAVSFITNGQGFCDSEPAEHTGILFGY